MTAFMLFLLNLRSLPRVMSGSRVLALFNERSGKADWIHASRFHVETFCDPS